MWAKLSGDATRVELRPKKVVSTQRQHGHTWGMNVIQSATVADRKIPIWTERVARIVQTAEIPDIGVTTATEPAVRTAGSGTPRPVVSQRTIFVLNALSRTGNDML